MTSARALKRLAALRQDQRDDIEKCLPGITELARRVALLGLAARMTNDLRHAVAKSECDRLLSRVRGSK